MLSKADIIRRMDPATDLNERLIVSPFFGGEMYVSCKEGSTSASIDFHLGNRFALPRRRKMTKHDPLREEKAGLGGDTEVYVEDYVDNHFIPFGGEFVLHPGQLALARTFEWIRLPHDIMAYVVGRSIWGRRGLMIATAIAIHPGSSGNITLELSNVGALLFHCGLELPLANCSFTR
jgi:dCTP deaminase